MMINYYTSHRRNNDTDLGRRYVNAVKTRNRVATSLLNDVIGHLEKLVTAYQRLKAVLAVDLIEHTTSVPGQIHESINTIVQHTQNHLAEFSSEIVDKFSIYYEQNMDFLVAQIIDSAKSILSQHFHFGNIDLNDTDSFNISRMEKIINSSDALCNDFDVLYASISNAETRGANFSTNLFVDRTCNAFDIFFRCYYVSQPLVGNGTDYINKLVERYEKLRWITRRLVRCVPMYRTFLNEAQSWLKSALTLNSSLPLQPEDRRYFLAELEDERNWLERTSRTFAEEAVVR